MHKLSMDELNRKSVQGFRAAEKNPIVVVLDNIRSMHNVGSVFRTADAFLIQQLILCGYTPRPPHRDIEKTALGATDTVHWKYCTTTVEAIAELRLQHYTVFAVEQTSESVQLDRFTSGGQPVALIFGNEVHGVQQEVLNLCDGSIEIPQTGMKHSLNISVAAGIVLWELVRTTMNKQRNFL
ncbi:MAG TPA: RNA methyltransferase [Flavitalea sp.]|nr:RNA methyltransferase [Flavitalea sp.]